MPPELSNNPSQSELRMYVRSENIDPRLLRPSASGGSEFIPRLKQITRATEHISKPLDLLATGSTDALILILQDVIRKIDPHAKLVLPMPWEQLWASRQTEPQAQGELPHNFADLRQKDAIIAWIVDKIFPLEALDRADNLYRNGSSGSGFRDTWLPHFEHVAEELVYARARAVVESAVDGIITGLITSLPAEMQTEAGLFKLIGLLATAEIGVKKGQKYNYLWGLEEALAADLRTVFGRETNNEINFNTAVNDMFKGSMDESIYELHALGTWTMLVFMALSAIIFRLPKRGPMAVVDGAIYAGLGSTAIRAVESGNMRSFLEKISAEFGAIRNKITIEAERTEAHAQLSQELVGSNSSVRELAEARDLITFLKNIPTELVAKILPLVTTTLAAILMGDSFTSAVFSVGQVAGKAVEGSGKVMTHLSDQEKRTRARERILEALRALSQSVYGPLTNEALEAWLNVEEEIDWDAIPLEIKISQIGVPPFTRADNGEAVKLVQCEDGFTVRKGDIVPIIGQNGSGKTLLMKVLAGVYTGIPNNTEITWGGVDTRKMDADAHCRRWKIIASSENDSLRQLLVSALLYKGDIRIHSLGLKIEKNKMLEWACGDSEYPELENAVTLKLQQWGINVHASEAWYKQELRPSGMQKAIANLAFHCLVKEPLNFLIDEAGGVLDSKRINDYIEFIRARSLAGELPGVVFVAINKDVGRWMLGTDSPYIDMRDVVQGHSKAGLDSEADYNEKLGMDIARELEDKFNLGSPMTPDQFIIWMTYGPGKEFDKQAAEVKKQSYEPQTMLHDTRNFNHLRYIYRCGVMEFESGKYAQYLKICLTSWFDELNSAFSEPSALSNSPINTHLAKILEAISVFYGRDSRAGDPKMYLRNLDGSVISNKDARWDYRYHEQVFAAILNKYLHLHVEKLQRAMECNLDDEQPEMSQYPESYADRYDLLESLLMIQNLTGIANDYYREGSLRDVKPFGEVPELATEVYSSAIRRCDHVLYNAQINYEYLQCYIVEDPLVLYNLAHETSTFHIKKFVDYFSLVISKMDRVQVENVRARLIEIKIPTNYRGAKVYGSFWNILNKNKVEDVETGWLQKIFDIRMAAILSE